MRAYLFLQVRQYVLGFSGLDWLKAAGGLIVFALILAIAGLFWTWVFVCVFAVGIAVALYYLLDRTIARQRQSALAELERIMRSLRLRGISEAAIQKFVCQYAGEPWEEPFEEQFGYEAKLAARAKWGAGPKGPRPRYAAWRDPIVHWIAARQRARQEARERRQLQVVEQEGLVAQGMQPAEAKRQAEAVAEAMVEQAAQIKDSGMIDALAEEVEPPAPPPQAKAPEPELPLAEPLAEIEPLPPPRPRPRVDVRQVAAAATRPPRPRRPSRIWPELRDKLLGPGGRFGIGGILVALGVVGLFLSRIAEDLRAAWTEPDAWEKIVKVLEQPRPILGAVMLEPMTALAAVAAGIGLVLSSFQPLRWRTLAHYACAVVMIAGPRLGIPRMEKFDATLVSLVVGGLPMLVLLVLAWLRPPD
jgi:hypothetical protein